jgi:hypothetical protein
MGNIGADDAGQTGHDLPDGERVHAIPIMSPVSLTSVTFSDRIGK